MPALPVPIIGSLVLGYLLILSLLRRDMQPLFLALLAVCAAQGVIISLAQHYNVDQFRIVQPINAALIPPLAWLAFTSSAIRPLAPPRDVLHAAGPVIVVICGVTAPTLLDVIIPAIFVGYGAAMLWRLRTGADGLSRLRLECGDMPSLVWRLIAAALIGSALSDGVIVLSQILGLNHWQPWIISLSSTIMVVMVGGLSLSRGLSSGDTEPDQTQRTPPTEVERETNAETMVRLAELVEGQQLYLDPDLTLSKLSRKLRIPVKQLSIAINQSTGENVSRYINGFRIAEARKRLTAGDSVTAAMLSSGFNTKSNFNREFLRLTGRPPRDWRDEPGVAS